MSRQTCKGALLISGEPGTGKSRWIREEASASKAKLFRWNARVDRSLREGREILHQQVRSKERLYVWIEGVDDLTQEAQAFLRRILETASANVTCCLEVREVWKLSPPILSRCTIITMRAENSYRVAKNKVIARHLGIADDSHTTIPQWNEIHLSRKRGENPYVILDAIVALHGMDNPDVQECIRAIGAGSSPWIQLTQFLIKVRPAQTL
jgi:DNA polymerase III delta prime subunit